MSARARATKGGGSERRGKVIAEFNFGFWRFLCSAGYLTSLWVPALCGAFPHHPRRRILGRFARTSTTA